MRTELFPVAVFQAPTRSRLALDRDSDEVIALASDVSLGNRAEMDMIDQAPFPFYLPSVAV